MVQEKEIINWRNSKQEIKKTFTYAILIFILLIIIAAIDYYFIA